jgi:superfamily I DNA/RNA helicase
VLVLAGAGIGRTRTLTTRIAHILNPGHARPSEILSVTFTNKAAREMKNRISFMVGQIVEGMPWLGTFHSISVKILRRHAELVGLKSNFTILDVDDQIRLIKQILEAKKRIYYFEQLLHAEEGWLSATSENMMLHVDMTAKKVTPFPDSVMRALAAMKAAHAKLPVPEGVGRRIAMPQKD